MQNRWIGSLKLLLMLYLLSLTACQVTTSRHMKADKGLRTPQSSSLYRNIPSRNIIDKLIAEYDITTGMARQDVRASWGEPEKIEVAGNPSLGIERWHYTEQRSSAEGYRTEYRQVFFENGRVVGWTTH